MIWLINQNYKNYYFAQCGSIKKNVLPKCLESYHM